MAEIIVDIGDNIVETVGCDFKGVLVRCKECRWYDADEDWANIPYCDMHFVETKPDGYCSWGKRVKQTEPICENCKWAEVEWADEPCENCCKNNSGFEPKQTEPSLEQFRVGLEYHTDTTHFGKLKGESVATNKTEQKTCETCRHYGEEWDSPKCRDCSIHHGYRYERQRKLKQKLKTQI